MTQEGLNFINTSLESLGIPYQFMLWKSSPASTYWTGEYNETTAINEDGMEESNFILTGVTNKSFTKLEETKEKIKNYFTYEGHTHIFESGSAIAVMYSEAYPVPSVDEGVHKIQITLNIKEWRV